MHEMIKNGKKFTKRINSFQFGEGFGGLLMCNVFNLAYLVHLIYLMHLIEKML